MQDDVDEVVAEDRVAPEFGLGPERAVEQWVVLLCGAELEPDVVQAVE